MRKFLVILTLLLTSSATASFAQTDQYTYDADERRDWVEDVEKQDFHFWRRFLLTKRAGIDRGNDWFIPSELVAGGFRPFFPTAEAGDRTIGSDALEAAANYAFERNTTAFYVLHKGKIQYSEFAEGAYDESVISARSFAKTVVSFLMGIALADEDINSLDDEIGSYIEEWKSSPEGKITLRQLLTNSSGLELPNEFEAATDPLNKYAQLVDGTDGNAAALAYRLSDEPGSVFTFNHVNTHLLSLVIQRATGQRYTDYLSKKFWRPLGAQRGTMRIDRIGGNPLTFCCFRTAPSDWVRVGHLLLNDGVLPDGERILPEGWVKQLTRPSDSNPQFGLHIWLGKPWKEQRILAENLPGAPTHYHSEPFASEDLFFMEGGGWHRLWIVPSADLVILRMGNMPKQGFDDSYIPNTIIRGILN